MLWGISGTNLNLQSNDNWMTSLLAKAQKHTNIMGALQTSRKPVERKKRKHLRHLNQMPVQQPTRLRIRCPTKL